MSGTKCSGQCPGQNVRDIMSGTMSGTMFGTCPGHCPGHDFFGKSQFFPTLENNKEQVFTDKIVFYEQHVTH